ncbi:MAG: ATP phosphoribosyltransferase regulatory subunit [Janthinobacterium lividum]
MTDDLPPNPALLPAGLHDLLPPEAETEAATVSALMEAFAAHGYDRVKPPLLEFEDGLLAGAGSAMQDQAFRVMDPATHRMMGVRADMTPQVARIASTRMAGHPRPLRLSYAGQCLLLRGLGLAADRQVAQAGIELIGVDSPAADAEIVVLAAAALAAIGLDRVSFDLTLPPLAPTLLDEAGITGAARQALTHALDRKDAAEVARHGGPIAGLLTDLLLVAGPAGPALDVLTAADLPSASAALCARLRDVVRAVQAQAPALRLTLDPIEFRGFRYHTGVCVTVFAPGRHEELGRGGRYVSGEAEPATGLTLFPDALLRALPPVPGRQRAFLPWGAPAGDAVLLRAGGYVTIPALSDLSDPVAEARRLGCTHILRDGTAVPLTKES